MSSSADLRKMQEALRAKKENLWKAINEYDEVCYQVLEEERQLDEYQRVYHSSLRIMHQCTTNFTNQLIEKCDKMITLEYIRVAHLDCPKMNTQKSVDDTNESNQKEGDCCESDGINESDSSFYQQADADSDNYMSDSEYTVNKRSSEKTLFSLEYKGKKYRSSKKEAPGLDVPIGLLRCTRLNKKCSGTIETIEKPNGRVHIKNRDAHTCE